MPNIAYIEKTFSVEHMEMLAHANRVIREFADMGYDLTLRQVYYQFVGHDLFPDDRRWRREGGRWVRDPNGTKNAEPNYKWLGGILDDGRMAGVVDWNAIVDRTRKLGQNNHWDDPQDLLNWAAEGYGFDTWKDQPERVEVWVEKEAMQGVIARPASEWDVAWFCCRGYVSKSALWRAANRLRQHQQAGQDITIIYLGDHDPSGLDIDRVTGETVDIMGVTVQLERIALNWDQVQQYNPPPNPTKLTDSRAKKYVPKYGYECWELDALDPRVLDELINEAIRRHCDEELLDAQRDQRDVDKARIQEIADTWKARP